MSRLYVHSLTCFYISNGWDSWKTCWTRWHYAHCLCLFLLNHFPPLTVLGITITKRDGKKSFKEILLDHRSAHTYGFVSQIQSSWLFRQMVQVQYVKTSFHKYQKVSHSRTPDLPETPLLTSVNRSAILHAKTGASEHNAAFSG